jgi:hypothetical protein
MVQVRRQPQMAKQEIFQHAPAGGGMGHFRMELQPVKPF